MHDLSEATSSAVDAPVTELRLDDHRRNPISLNTGSHRRLDLSKSQPSSRSRDRRTCRAGEVAELSRWLFVVIVCAGWSVLALLPVAMVGGPTQAGRALSRLALPARPPSGYIMDQLLQQDDVDTLRSSADLQRLHLDFDLRQLLALRQLHGTLKMTDMKMQDMILIYLIFLSCALVISSTKLTLIFSSCGLVTKICI